MRDWSISATGMDAAPARPDESTYQKSIKISDKQIKQLEADRIHRHNWHGEWNYTTVGGFQHTGQLLLRPCLTRHPA